MIDSEPHQYSNSYSEDYCTRLCAVVERCLDRPIPSPGKDQPAVKTVLAVR
jgi:hypothetical protein